MSKCEPFRLKPTLPKQRKCSPVIRVRESDFWLLSDLRDRSGCSLCEIIHQCLEYCMRNTDLRDQELYPGLLGVQIQDQYLAECDEDGNS